MYIRTKDGVYLKIRECDENNKILIVGKTITDFGTYIEKKDIISQSENLEELCDEYCYIKDDVISQYLTIDFKFKRDDDFCALRNKLTANGIAEISKGISKYELENGELKFAIWTSKGLIYVAKMNNEGKLELI